ncbi:hypothetical protein HD554DRAFT_2002350, partial [Boletus coccyginus]
PKAADYDKGIRSIIQTAIGIYCTTLLDNDPFALPVKEIEWARAAWKKAYHHHHVNILYDAGVLKLITAHMTHLWGQFKSKAHTIVRAVYGFDTGPDNSTVDHNHALFLQLKQDLAFIFWVHATQTYLYVYMMPAIQQVINTILFKNWSDNGVQWAKYYKPFPIVGFALTLTAIKCAINKWESDVHEMIVFKEHEYSTVFKSHLASLKEFQTMTAPIGLLAKLLQQAYNHGCTHAGIVNSGIQTDKPMKAIPNHAFLKAIDEYKHTEGTTD